MNVNRNVAQANGLSQLSDQDMNVVMDKVLSKSWNLSLDDFKKALYESMQNYLFNGVEWNHATSVAGTRLGAKGKDVWMGLGWSFFTPTAETNQGVPVKDGEVVITSLLNFMYDYTIQDSSKFDAKAIPDDSISLDTIQQLENDLSAKKATTNAANQNVAKAKAHTADAQKALSAAQVALTTAKSQQTKAHAAVDEANATVKAATVAVAAAQKAVDEANASDAVKQQALADAQAALKDAQAVQGQKHAILDAAKAKLANANQALGQAKARLASAEATLKAGQQALADKENHLNDLENVDSQLADAKQVVVDAQAKLAQLEYQKEINDAIDGKNDNTNKPIDNSNDNKDSNTESVNNSNDNQIDNNETTVNLNNEVVNSGLITNNLAHTRATVITPAMVASKSLSNNKNSQAAKGTLPQTNEEGGQTASILGLMMIGIVGIFGTAKKRKQL
ncbi:hypothetical protein S100892_01760 [Pediococcus pentosaceus]|nr:hypothetical protein S100892_01760 [Pediococcus pentosaceus]